MRTLCVALLATSEALLACALYDACAGMAAQASWCGAGFVYAGVCAVTCACVAAAGQASRDEEG